MQNADLDELQLGIRIARRNINSLRYADDATLMAESEQELKNPLRSMREERLKKKNWFKTQHKKTKIMASGPIISWQIDGETMETVTDFLFLGFKITADGYSSHEVRRHLLLPTKAVTNLDSILKSKSTTLLTKSV